MLCLFSHHISLLPVTCNNTCSNYGTVTSRETLGTVGRHTESTPLMPSGFQTTGNNNTKYEMEHEIQTT